MLPRHPTPEREESTSPALARRRDHMLRSDAVRHIEPRLVPSEDERHASLPPQRAFDLIEDEPEPDIPPPPGALHAESEDSPKDIAAAAPRRRLWLLSAAMAAIFVVGGAAWLVYEETRVVPAGGEIPYVTAEAGPEKIRPQQEGGIEAPDQDIRIYSELNGSKPASKSEVLLPPPETPIAPPRTAADAPAQTAPETATAEVPIVPAPPAEVAPAAGTDTQQSLPPPAPEQDQPGQDQQAAAPAAQAAADQPAQVATAAGAFRIQLAAVKTHDAAEAAWKKMAKRYPDVLKALSLNIVKVNKGSGSVLFRVRAGPFASREAAESACGKLKQKKQDCLVVAP